LECFTRSACGAPQFEGKKIMSPTASPTDDPVLVMSRTFDASAEAVFDAWTHQDEWQSWIGPRGGKSEVTTLHARVGGRFRLIMRTPDGRTMPIGGEFREVDRPRKLVLTWGLETHPDHNSMITLTFRDVGGKCDFTLRQEGLVTAENRDAHGAGWSSAFGK